MALRGFDDYQITLGDEMRGERASLGVSLTDVERDLKIRSRTILAIENADLTGFPMESVVAGYVRSYARYLGMDPEEAFQRFCEESGFRSPSMQMQVTSGSLGGQRVALNSRVGGHLSESRFAPPPAPEHIGSRVPLAAIASSVALIAVVAGIGFGGWHVLQDIQKVGIAEAPAEPVVFAEEVELASAPQPIVEIRTSSERPDASVYDDDGILANAGAIDLSPPKVALRDGPISEIDPRNAGLYAPVGRLDDADPRNAGPTQNWDGDVQLASLTQTVPTEADRLTMSAGALVEALTPRAQPIYVHAAGEAWIRIKDADGRKIYEGIVAAGSRVRLPDGVSAPELRAGNAGEVFLMIGSQAYGPVGKPGRVVKRIPIDAEAVRSNLPEAVLERVDTADEEPMRRAEVDLTR